MHGLVPGRIVYFVLDGPAVARIGELRAVAGYFVHGNTIAVGDIRPAMVLAIWHDDGLVNLKVALDGSDEYWATSVAYDQMKVPGTWHWMFEGQATRRNAVLPKASEA